MIVGGQTKARAQLSSTIIDYHEPFDQGFKLKDCEVKRKISNIVRLSFIIMQTIIL